MRADRVSYEQLLESIADGTPIDWAALGPQTRDGRDERRYRNIRMVARIAELHRTITIENERNDRTPPALADGSAPPPSASSKPADGR